MSSFFQIMQNHVKVVETDSCQAIFMDGLNSIKRYLIDRFSHIRTSDISGALDSLSI